MKERILFIPCVCRFGFLFAFLFGSSMFVRLFACCLLVVTVNRRVCYYY